MKVRAKCMSRALRRHGHGFCHRQYPFDSSTISKIAEQLLWNFSSGDRVNVTNGVFLCQAALSQTLILPNMATSFENLVEVQDYCHEIYVSYVTLQCELVVPAWTAGTQVDMDVSRRILLGLDDGNPCRHDGGYCMAKCGRVERPREFSIETRDARLET